MYDNNKNTHTKHREFSENIELYTQNMKQWTHTIKNVLVEGVLFASFATFLVRIGRLLPIAWLLPFLTYPNRPHFETLYFKHNNNKNNYN